jgi:hypothetical protein
MTSWFACSHKNISFPITLPRNAEKSNAAAKTYVVCLDCGRELLYSWAEMKVLNDESEMPPK